MTHLCAQVRAAGIEGATLAEAMKQIRGPAPTVRATILHLILDPGTDHRHDPAADGSNTATEANRVTGYGVRIGVGTRFSYDGEVVEITEVLTTPAGNEVLLKGVHDKRIRRMALRELLNADNARVIPEGPGPTCRR